MAKRPQFHFTPKKNWMNDPNGLCFYKGKYHLFYQHNPLNLYWGNMTWGHATSDDLFNWEYQSYALCPNIAEDIDGCFSGSAFEKDGELYLAYTGVIMTEKKLNEYGNPVTVRDDSMIATQLFAKSKDGLHFKKLNSPKIKAPSEYCKAHFRDPKVWEKDGKYYMVLGAKKDNKGRILIYQSSNLEDWKFLNEIYEENMGFMWECPDLFELNNKDVLIFSPQGIGTEGQEHLAGYYLGKFDYDTYKFEHDKFEVLDNGFELYAPQTFKDSKDRRIMIAWLVNHQPFPNEEWTGMMTLPRELKIVDNKLFCYPVKELNNYRKNLVTYSNISKNSKIEIKDEIYDMEFQIECSDDFEITLGDNNKNGLKLSYNSKEKILYFDREGAINGFEALKTFGTTRKISYFLKGRVNFRIIRDRNVVEIYINNGEKVLTSLVNFSSNQKYLNIEGDCETIKIYSLNK